MTWSESVDQALCFGWIDGVRYKVDEEGYRIRFTPRKKTSRWSAINIAKVRQLKLLGLMMPAGLEAFSYCKEPETAQYSFEAPLKELPEEYRVIFQTNSKAWDFFGNQPPSYKRMVVHWVLDAKRRQTQLFRLQRLISDSAQCLRINEKYRKNGKR
jgi:uncharacterized protein YdeI (YjbR/CyaY-like superfamily)